MSDPTLKALVASTPAQIEGYAGAESCKSCHQDFYAPWVRSDHAKAVRLVTPAVFGAMFHDPEEIPDPASGLTYGVDVKDGRCVITVNGQGMETDLLPELAMGSGRNGITFLGKNSSERWVAMRISHYALTGHWDYSPQQEPNAHRGLDPAGDPLGSRTELESCLSCHVTTLEMAGESPNLHHTTLGIDCERCHGPGKAHVESFRRGPGANPNSFVPMPSLERWSAARITALCDQCHSSPGGSAAGASLSPPELARFQSTAFLQSRCYRNSKTFSCVTCHDPHRDLSPDDSSYEKVCLSCHSLTAPHHASICKVSPTSGCIRCHMPTQTEPSTPNTSFHNHWIRVWPGVV